MYYFLSLLNGVVVAIMLLANGRLTGFFGTYSATIIIHLTGLFATLLLALAKRDSLFKNRQPWYLYLGGAIGVLTTLCTNYAFGKISLSALLAISLLGQSVAGIVVDHFGILGMPVHKFQKTKMLGLLLELVGIYFMVTEFHLLPILVTFLAGFFVVAARTCNVGLAEATNTRIGSVFNYGIGLLTTIPIFLLLGMQEPMVTTFTFSPELFIYIGGPIGVISLLLSNATAIKISAFYMTLLLFVGQVYSGVVLDAIIDKTLSVPNIIGGCFVAAGLCVNLWMDKRSTEKNKHLTLQETV